MFHSRVFCQSHQEVQHTLTDFGQAEMIVQWQTTESTSSSWPLHPFRKWKIKSPLSSSSWWSPGPCSDTVGTQELDGHGGGDPILEQVVGIWWCPHQHTAKDDQVLQDTVNQQPTARAAEIGHLSAVSEDAAFLGSFADDQSDPPEERKYGSWRSQLYLRGKCNQPMRRLQGF